MHIIRIILLLICFSWQLSAQKRPMRAVWLTTNYRLDWPTKPGITAKDIEQQKQEMVSMLENLDKIGINTIFFQARLKGTVLYHSKIERQSRFLTGNKAKQSVFDPLAYLLEVAKSFGMECHAWMVCMPLGTNMEIALNGLQSFIQKHKKDLTYHQKNWYLEPSSDFAAAYLSSIASEIVRNYPVDGIHLDYIRYPDNCKGYPDVRQYRASGSKLSLEDWRRGNITKVVAKIYDDVKSIDSSVQVSSSPLGVLRERIGQEPFYWNAHGSVFQDVEQWVKMKKQDFVVPMIYFETASFAKAVFQWKAVCGEVPIVPGLGIYKLNEPSSRWTCSDIQHQLFISEQFADGNYALFRANHVLKENPFLFWTVQLHNASLDRR